MFLLLEQRKGREFQGKRLQDIALDNDVYYSSESENNREGSECNGDEKVPLAECILQRQNSSASAMKYAERMVTSQCTHTCMLYG